MSTALPAHSTQDSRCNQPTSDGRHCTSLVYPGHTSLCYHHLRQQLDRAPLTEDIAGEILSSVENFQSATAVNAALGRVLTLLAAGRIKRKDAIAMSYICQLMLQSLKGFKQEIALTRYEKLWERDLAKLLFSRIPLQDFIAAPEPEEEQSEEDAEPPQSQSVENSAGKSTQIAATESQDNSQKTPQPSVPPAPPTAPGSSLPTPNATSSAPPRSDAAPSTAEIVKKTAGEVPAKTTQARAPAA